MVGPHQGIGDATPAGRYGTEPIPGKGIWLAGFDQMTEPIYPPGAFVRTVGSSGNLGFRAKLIQVGARFIGARVRVVEVERFAHIYHGDTLIRVLTIDPDRYYQPKPGKEPPHPTKKRHVCSQNKVSHIIPVQTGDGERGMPVTDALRAENCP